MSEFPKITCLMENVSDNKYFDLPPKCTTTEFIDFKKAEVTSSSFLPLIPSCETTAGDLF